MNRTFAVLLPAAGSGRRFNAGAGGAGGEADKLLMDLRGKSVLQRAVGLFARHPLVGRVLIVTGEDRFGTYRQHLKGVVEEERLSFTAGGRERWESVLMGLRYLAGLNDVPGYVAVHDAARPLAPAGLIDEALRTAVAKGAALPALGEPATLKRRGADGCVVETVDRRGLFQAQTPQCFGLGALLAGYEALLKEGRVGDLTDDAQVFERRGLAVPMTAGSALNLKITTPEDVALANAILAGG